jgi:ABC-2 type transport system ATP-binding protein
VRRCLGVAPQELALYDELTADENLRFFGRLYGLSGRGLSARVDRVLGFAGLTERRRSRAGTYSGGMKRRLNLAIALVHDPEWIILDEPTAGVDPQSRNALLEGVLALKADGRTVLYTTHYMEEAERLCDRVAILDHGRLLALDTVDALIARHGGRGRVVARLGHEEVQVETDDPLAELSRMQATGGLREFRVTRPSLEQVFLNLTGRRLRDG